MNVEHVEVTQTFTYLDSVIHSSTSCELEVNVPGASRTSLERDEFAGRMCVALPVLARKDEGQSVTLASSPGLVVLLLDLDSLDRRAKSETELLWYFVTPPNPWLPMA